MLRDAPLDLSRDQFRTIGHRLVDRIADLLDSMDRRPVTPGDAPQAVRALLGQGPLPEWGADPDELMSRVTDLLIDHSLYNGHPRFLGYITASPHPIGILGDLLASAVNPNCGGWALSPVATEMEAQCIRWIAEFIGYPEDCGGLLVSGGAMANYIGFLAARHAKAPGSIREDGMASGEGRLRVYCSAETHTWIEKASDMFGLGTNSVRWVETDRSGRMSMEALREQITADRRAGDHPIMVVGTAGTVGTGTVDPLPEIADLCREEDLWFHVDGAYGALAARVAGAPPELAAVARADSVAVDPHKWLYTSLEAGCALVRDAEALRDTFSYRPPYYRFLEVAGEEPISYYEYGPQNSRGFRALKVWLGLMHAGREGYERMIAEDIELARKLYQTAEQHDELDALTHHLSITTYRYVPPGRDLRDPTSTPGLNQLNERIVNRMQDEGEAFVSHTTIDGMFALRACVVNFRTTPEDIEAVAGLTVRLGRELAAGTSR
jgi:glutamate/tyrosine decarboxylase-like PLP-dependent enzyme